MADYNCISFHLFFILIFYSFLRVESFIPLGRVSHSSILVENKLYFFGGDIGLDINIDSNEVFYLDVSQQFDAEFPTWTDLTINSGIGFKSAFAAIALNNDNHIYLIGGTMQNQNNEDSFTSLVHKFNPKSGQWEVPIIAGKEPARRRFIKAVADNFGNIYVFGGLADKFVGSNVVQYFNDMIILNTIDLTWSYGPVANAPLKRVLYTATILPGGEILYIGGVEDSDNALNVVDINQIYIFHTKNNVWSVMVST
ncbi:12457_t:CDS:1 [Funneliformis geosporum]|uniref:12457_t:CDS:1 n=1 Tax=Funneliformis geosporum TaxID=1117311 RepID=A0A9W4SM29_9GLOM|nr:12457_t:CDS:1 [Funneliformis geosporum]